MSLIVDTKADKMSVIHNVKAKTEKMFDGKADKMMSVYQNTQQAAKAEKIVDAKVDMMSVYHVEAKAEKMSVHHVVNEKTEKIVDTKAVKLSVPHDAKAKMTEKLFDGKAGKKHSISIHLYGAKSTKGVLVHDGMFQLRD
jgi:hypothetical protein